MGFFAVTVDVDDLEGDLLLRKNHPREKIMK